MSDPNGPAPRGPPPAGLPGPANGNPPPSGLPPILSSGPPRGPPPSGGPGRGPLPPQGGPPRGPPPGGPPTNNNVAPPRGPPPGLPPSGGLPRGPPPSAGPPSTPPTGPPRGPPPSVGTPGVGPPRGPPPSTGPPGAGPPRGPPSSAGPPSTPPTGPPRGPPPSAGTPGIGPPRGPPPTAGTPGVGPPRGPPPAGTPSSGPPRGPPPMGTSPGSAPPRGPPLGPPTSITGPPPRGPPSSAPTGPPPITPMLSSSISAPQGPPPMSAPPPRGPPVSSMNTAGPSPPGIGPPRGPPPGMGAPRSFSSIGQPGAPPMGPPISPPRSAPPPGAPPRGVPQAYGQSGDAPRGPPSSLPRGPLPSGPPPRGGTFVPLAPRVPPPPNALPPLQLIAPPTAAAPPKFGRLYITCMGGNELKHGLGMFGKADPYARLRIGIQEYATKSHPGGGKNPIWNEEFVFDISNEKDIEIEILDKQSVGNDKFMGSCRVSIVDWIASGSYEGTIDINDKTEKNVGSINIKARFERPSAMVAQVMKEKESNPAAAMAMVPGSDNTAAMMNFSNTRDPNGKFTDDEILEAFRAFDLDKNNFIGAAEIRHILINIGEQVTDEEVDEMIKMVDFDGDGQVSWPEFYSMVTGGQKPPPELGMLPKPGSTAGSGSGASGGPTAPIPLPSGATIIQLRNKKKAALENISKECNLKPDSVKKAYKKFQIINKDKSGLVDYTEFYEILEVDSSPVIEAAFNCYDHDNIGQIDMKEFLIAVSNFTGSSKEDKLKFAFTVFDESGTGALSRVELIKILRANHMATHDAEVSRKADTIMAQADKDGDGVITYDEFVIVSKKFPNILFPAYQTKAGG